MNAPKSAPANKISAGINLNPRITKIGAAQAPEIRNNFIPVDVFYFSVFKQLHKNHRNYNCSANNTKHMKRLKFKHFIKTIPRNSL